MVEQLLRVASDTGTSRITVGNWEDWYLNAVEERKRAGRGAIINASTLLGRLVKKDKGG